MLEHAAGKELFVQDLIGGADVDYSLPTRVVTEFAWHSLFIRNLLIRPELSALAAFVPKLTIIDLPSFKADPERYGCRTETVIACDFTNGLVLIGGTSYAGEMKKSVFTVLNYLLPAKGVMPMHCSANAGPDGDAAVFFGLSGTGKTTLSADPSRTLIGDDEHGWGENGIFNFEGGCYAKTIRLSAEAEPEIYATTQRFGTVLENVVLNEQREPDFDDGSLTENTRCAYPLDFIPNASKTGLAAHPKTIIMLTADAFGVMPPIARLTPDQAMYHFLSGYTAKVAGTEKGVTEPEATFSTCFGAPFMPRHPAEYGNLLKELIGRHGVDCWLVNTGWTGGAYGTGKRMPIKATRALLSAALSGDLGQGQISVLIRTLVLLCRSLSRVSKPASSTRARPGRTARPMTSRQKSSSRCSFRTSQSSRHMSTAACGTRRLESRSLPNKQQEIDDSRETRRLPPGFSLRVSKSPPI